MNTDKRYLVFAGHGYYPSGGWNDFQKSFSYDEAAKLYAAALRAAGTYDWAHVVDLVKMERID